MKKISDVYKSIRFAKLDPQHDKSHKGGSQDDEEHYTVGEKEWEQQVKHAKKRAMQEEKKDKYDEGEYDREGDMAKSDLRSIMANAKRLHDMIGDSDNLPEWCQNKITVAEDYISTVANYLTSEMNEAFKMPPESVAEKMARNQAERRKKSGLPDPSHYLKVAAQKKKELEDMKKEEVELDEARFSGLKPNFNKKEPMKHYGPEEPNEKDEIKNSYHKEKKQRIQNALEKFRQERFPNVKEEVKSYVPSPHAKPVPKKPKGEYERKVEKYLKKKYNKEEVEYVEEGAVGRVISKVINKLHSANAKKPLPQASDRREYEKPKIEQVVQEGRPSQRHPLEGHDYHKKSNAELIGIAKDAHAAAEAMKGHSPRAENKYRDQANDSATVRYFRQKSGMPDWYKKKYGHVKEDVEQLDELSPALLDRAAKIATKKGKDARAKGHDEAGDEHFGQAVRLRSGYHSAVERYRKKASMASMSPAKQRKYAISQKRAMGEDVEYLEEKNVPTSPEKWAQAKAQAKQKFDVYPSAYANGWAAKKYKEMGGDWKSVSEETISESRKTEIIKKLVKKKTNTEDKFEPNPVMLKTRDDRDH